MIEETAYFEKDETIFFSLLYYFILRLSKCFFFLIIKNQLLKDIRIKFCSQRISAQFSET